MTPSAPLRSAAKNPMRTAGRPVSVLANVPGGDRVPARLARAAARRDSPLPATTSRPWPHSHKHRALNRCARYRRGTPAQLMRTPARGSRTGTHAGQGYQAGGPAPARRQGPHPTRTGESVRAAAGTLAKPSHPESALGVPWRLRKPPGPAVVIDAGLYGTPDNYAKVQRPLFGTSGSWSAASGRLLSTDIRNCPVAAVSSARWWPPDLPGGGHQTGFGG